MPCLHHSTCCSTWCECTLFLRRKLLHTSLEGSGQSEQVPQQQTCTCTQALAHHPAVAVAQPSSTKSTITTDRTVRRACQNVSLNLRYVCKDLMHGMYAWGMETYATQYAMDARMVRAQMTRKKAGSSLAQWFFACLW